MTGFIKNAAYACCLACIILSAPMSAHAHLMKAHHGTLKFQDDGVYMVLSLSASAFKQADEDGDGLLSAIEITKHHTSLLELISQHVTLGTKAWAATLENVLIYPITPHSAPKDPADRIVVLGRFSPAKSDEPLRFSVALFGTEPAQQVLNIRATKPDGNLKQLFKVTSSANSAELDFN